MVKIDKLNGESIDSKMSTSEFAEKILRVELTPFQKDYLDHGKEINLNSSKSRFPNVNYLLYKMMRYMHLQYEENLKQKKNKEAENGTKRI